MFFVKCFSLGRSHPPPRSVVDAIFLKLAEIKDGGPAGRTGRGSRRVAPGAAALEAAAAQADHATEAAVRDAAAADRGAQQEAPTSNEVSTQVRSQPLHAMTA